MVNPGSASYRDKSSLFSPANWGNQPRYGDFHIVTGSDGKARLLGAGSFGKTFEAVRTDEVAGSKIEEYVALKVLDPSLMASEAKRKQFVQELLALTKFKHSNLIHYIRCGEQEGEVFYAMQLCKGGDLSHLVKRYGPLPEKAVAIIALQVAAGLREMHQRHKLVHRDIKPSNIMLEDELPATLARQQLAARLEEQDSLCRIVDFGLVNAQVNAGMAPGTQRFAGSPMYASPEQVREQPVDGRSDIYSLGMTLWYLLQGRGPLLDAQGHELRDHVEALRRHSLPGAHDAHFPKQMTDAFRRVLSRMVAKNLEDRFQSAAELQTALREYLQAISEIAKQEPKKRKVEPLRIGGQFERSYALEKNLPTRMGRSCFLVRHIESGERFMLTMLADLESPRQPPDLETHVADMCRLVELTRDRDFPPGILPVREVVWSEDLVGVLEGMPEMTELSDVLRVRTELRRPISFPEAAPMFYTLADSLDFLLQNDIERVAMPCEDVWLLSDRTPEEIAAKADGLALPLTEWPGLLPVMSMVWLPPAEEGAGAEASIQRTVSSSMQLSASKSHPVPSFCRLLYRVISGTEIPAAAEFVPTAYVQTAALSAASNNLIRDLVSKSDATEQRVSAVLAEICMNEGVMKSSRGTSRTSRGTSRAGASQAATVSRATKSVFHGGAPATQAAAPPPPPLPPESSASKPASTTRKNILIIAGALAVALVLLGFAWMNLFHKTPAPEAGDVTPPVTPPPEVPAKRGDTPPVKPAELPAHKPVTPPPVTPPPVTPAPPTPSKPVALSVPEGYPTIAEALAAAKAGDTVLIKAGAYAEQLRLPDGVSLKGEEPGRVMIGIESRVGSVLDVDGCKSGSTIAAIVFSHSDKSVPASDPTKPMPQVSPVVNVLGGKVTFQDCVFESGVGSGIEIRATARVSLVNCRARKNLGCGVHVWSSTLEMDHCELEMNGRDGLRAFGAGCLVTSKETISRRNSLSGMVAEDGGKITATASTASENKENGLAVQGAGSVADWTSGAISDNGFIFIKGSKSPPVDAGRRGGIGVSVEQGGSMITMVGATISGNRNHGVVFTNPQSGSSLAKCMVRQNGRSGVQIFGVASTALRIEGGEITDNPETGLDIGGEAGFRPVLFGVRIAGNGIGVSVLDSAEPQLERCVLENNKPTDIDRAGAGPGMSVK